MMTDEQWRQFRLNYLGQNNIYLPDTPEVRAQHDLEPGHDQIMPASSGPQIEFVNVEAPVQEDKSSAFDLPSQASEPIDPKTKMLETMRRRKNQG